jgi:CDP-glucose 4,6-dehydratase
MFVEDVVEAYLTLAEALTREGIAGQAFNFGWGKGYSVLAVVEMILEQAGAGDVKPKVLGQASGEIIRQWLSAEKAKRVLGWQPRIDLAEGIRRSVDWYREFLELGDRPASVVGGGRA